MIPAKYIEGELWIKASDFHIEVKRLIDAEREACAKICEKEQEECGYDANVIDVAKEIRARGQ